jgi:hypothetical protein
MGSDAMLILIFSLTLLIAFNVYKFTGREQYMTGEKPLWKKLIYWGIMLFVSIIFNVIMYSANGNTYRLSSYMNNDNAELIIFFIVCCLAIQFLSPSLFGGIIISSMRAFIRRNLYDEPEKKTPSEENTLNYTGLSSGKTSNIYAVEKIKTSPEGIKALQEKDFELFLNSLCWLAFAFAFFVSILSAVIAYGADVSIPLMSSIEYNTAGEQLNHIASIMLIFTLPITLRQILFHLGALRRAPVVPDRDLELNSMRYQKYLLVQKRLERMNKRL